MRLSFLYLRLDLLRIRDPIPQTVQRSFHAHFVRKIAPVMHLEQTSLDERLAQAVPILGKKVKQFEINELLWIRRHILVLWLIELC